MLDNLIRSTSVGGGCVAGGRWEAGGCGSCLLTPDQFGMRIFLSTWPTIIGNRPAFRALGAAPATIYRRRRPPVPRAPRIRRETAA